MATTITVTTGYPKLYSMGSLNLYMWRATDIDDTETLETGLGNKIVSHLVSWTGASTAPAGGGHSVLSSGTITFYPAADDLGADIWVATSV